MPSNYGNVSFLPDIVGETPQDNNKDRDIQKDEGAGFDNGFFHATG
jgi:hypothetical protein